MAYLFIKKTCKKLALRVPATCTAQVFYHRFFARQSLKNHDKIDVATTCIFLACKVEENWKHLDEILEAAHAVRHSEKMETLAKNPDVLENMRENILMYERIVLNTLSFDVSVDHPHKFADKFVKLVTTGQPREYRELLQSTCNIMNDSLSTTLCLRYQPRLIAAACVSLAVKFLKARAIYQQQKPRFVEIVAKFEKQGELFGYPPTEIRPIEDELVKFYETDLLKSTNPATVASSITTAATTPTMDETAAKKVKLSNS